MRERNRWTAEEYREFLRTGKEPDGERDREKPGNRAAAPCCCQPAAPSGVTLEQLDPKKYPWANPPGEKERKYHNKPVKKDGIRFDSKHEAQVYEELMLRVKAGELRAVMVHVPFQLPGGIRYVADFVTLTADLKIEGVYDAKSRITKKNRVYINKKKQMKSEWGIEIQEV